MPNASQPNELFARYRHLQAYVGWTEDDARRVHSALPHVEMAFVALINDFYDRIERHPETLKVITGGRPQVERLRGTLLKWVRDLFSGKYDADYVERRWRAGRRHVEIGLDQVYANAALSRLRTGLMQALQTHWQGELRQLQATVRSLNTLLDLDLAVIEDAYQTEYLYQDVQRRTADLQTLLNVVPIGIAMAEDPQCNFIRVNKSFANLLRIPPEGNASSSAPPGERPSYKVIHNGKELPAEQQPMQLAASTGKEIRDVEIDLVFPDATVVNLFGYVAPLLSTTGQARGAVGAFLDVTERKNAQERLLQTERLAAIGQMMTGLAHESGNALARSQVCLEMLALEIEDRPEAINLLKRAQIAQIDLQQLYEEVRGYAAPIRLEREPTNLAAIWRQAWTSLDVLRKDRRAELREEVGEIDVRCAVDAFRLQQVFRNILENALSACKDPVVITIQSLEMHLNGRPAVRIVVRDNGPGLSEEQKRRIFEPFFTTKTKGTGLGMAIAKRILQEHGGLISAGNALSGGAEITIIVPRECP